MKSIQHDGWHIDQTVSVFPDLKKVVTYFNNFEITEKITLLAIKLSGALAKQYKCSHSVTLKYFFQIIHHISTYVCGFVANANRAICLYVHSLLDPAGENVFHPG